MLRRPHAGALALVAIALCAQGAAAERGLIRDRDRKPLPASHIVTEVTAAFDRELAAGEDVVLTVDREVQKLAEKAVRRHEAAAVAVVEVETGRILALVSTPAGDPVDRTLAKTYRPASTFKLVTAVAALENSLASPEEEMTCTGTRQIGDHVLRDMEVHGTIDLLEALQRSCNVYFWALAERVGIDRLAAVARDFGFGSRTGLGIDGEVAGQVPDQRLYDGDANHNLELTLNTAVGLGEVRVSVVQLAMAYAALANGGRLFVPQVVRRIEHAGGEVSDRPPVLRRHVAASASTLDIIRRGMTRAVNARGGTAFTARRGAVKMVGKTGTFEPPDRDEADALFAGWAPSEHPEIAVVVLIERGGVGGEVAAPAARAIIDGYFTRVHPAHPKAKAHRGKKKPSKKKVAQAKKAKKAKEQDAHRKARANLDRKRRRR